MSRYSDADSGGVRGVGLKCGCLLERKELQVTEVGLRRMEGLRRTTDSFLLSEGQTLGLTHFVLFQTSRVSPRESADEYTNISI